MSDFLDLAQALPLVCKRFYVFMLAWARAPGWAINQLVHLVSTSWVFPGFGGPVELAAGGSTCFPCWVGAFRNLAQAAKSVPCAMGDFAWGGKTPQVPKGSVRVHSLPASLGWKFGEVSLSPSHVLAVLASWTSNLFGRPC